MNTTDQPPRAACASHVDDWLWTEHKPSEETIALAEAKPICGGLPRAGPVRPEPRRHLVGNNARRPTAHGPQQRPQVTRQGADRMKRTLLAFDLAILAFIFGTLIAVTWGADKRWGETAYLMVGPLLFSGFGWLYVYYKEMD